MDNRWPTKQDYLSIREKVMATQEGGELVEWARTLQRPKNAADLALRLVSAVITSGYSYHSGMGVLKRVEQALVNNLPVFSVFKNKRKAGAIEKIWSERQSLLKQFKTISTETEALNWCDGIPFIRGPAVRFQALRDLGAADVAKPDRLMERIAARAGESVRHLTERLSRLTSDRVGVVDMVLWYAASIGIIEGISGRRSALSRCHSVLPRS